MHRALLIVVLWQYVQAQNTLAKSGCSFATGESVFHIQLARGPEQQPCMSSATLNDQLKNAQSTSQELVYEVMQLQGQLLRMQDEQRTLSQKVDAQQESSSPPTPGRGESGVCPVSYTLKNAAACYMFVLRHHTWYEAESFCMSTGGHLVAIESQEEQDFIVQHIRSEPDLPERHLWTGANDIAKEADWVWAGINQRMEYTHWMLYEGDGGETVQMPDNNLDAEHCVQLFHLYDYQWNDAYCGSLYNFICEFKL